MAKIAGGDNPSDSYDRVYRDFAEGPKLGIGGTPTFFVQVKNGPTKKVAFSALEEELKTGVFAAYVH
ncbi:hypothetical protein EON77_06460 [bacterium]|nr:MAG: hypothetical protein EON77_06460 [bacterium]